MEVISEIRSRFSNRSENPMQTDCSLNQYISHSSVSGLRCTINLPDVVTAHQVLIFKHRNSENIELILQNFSVSKRRKIITPY